MSADQDGLWFFYDIAQIVGVGMGSVSPIIKQGVATGSLTSKREAKCGCKTKTRPKDVTFLVRPNK